MIIFKAKYNPYNIKHLITVLAVRLNRDTSSGSGKKAKYVGDAKLFHTTVLSRVEVYGIPCSLGNSANHCFRVL